MHGIYIDDNAQLVIVSPYATGYMVHLADDVAVAKVKNKRSVQLEREEGSMKAGLYNGSDCVTWEGGDKWRRVDMSAQQFRMLTTRPYVPLTFVVTKLLMQLGGRMLTALLAMGVWKSGSYVT